MPQTGRSVIDSVVRSLYGHAVEGLAPLTGGGLHETYRADVRDGDPVVVRIARRPVSWFTDEEHLMALARAAGVPTPEVIGTEQVDHEGELLSFSVQRLVPGRSLAELPGDLPAADLERLVLEGGELLARVHGLVADRGMRHDLFPPEADAVARATSVAREVLGPAAAATVELGAGFLRSEVAARSAPRVSLVHGDWLPKHLMVDDLTIVGVIDWEFAGPVSPAYDLARWEVSAGDAFHDRSDLLRRGYARVADPDSAGEGWVPAFAVDWALEVLAWEDPAPPERLRRCVDVIARHADPVGS